MGNVIRNMLLDVMPDVFPVIVIITVIVCSLRVAYLIKTKTKFSFYKELFYLLFILYVMCLFEIVTIQDVNYGTSNFYPFTEIFRYRIGSRLFIKNIIGNILLFMPYGYFVSYFLKTKKAIPVVILTFIVSITIEIVQLKIGRTFDVDDVILNTVGGFVGFSMYYLITTFTDKLPKPLHNHEFTSFLVILIVIIVIIYMLNFNIVNWIG